MIKNHIDFTYLCQIQTRNVQHGFCQPKLTRQQFKYILSSRSIIIVVHTFSGRWWSDGWDERSADR